jgi:hypothetical protein
VRNLSKLFQAVTQRRFTMCKHRRSPFIIRA